MAQVTFSIAPVAPAQDLLPTVAQRESLSELLRVDAEAFSETTQPIIGRFRYHPLVAAAHVAFCRHYPLVLSPDHIWLCIAQGVAMHINNHAEKLRSQLVQHAGKKTLSVQRDDFVKGAADNPWREVFDQFTEQLRNYIPELSEVMCPNFSTTGPVERSVYHVTLMDSVKAYFEFEMITLCGIPSITLLGTSDDWDELRRRIANSQFERLGLQFWTKILMPVLDEFVNAAKGAVDPAFWRSFYHYKMRSHGTPLTGWINCFFPYTDDGQLNIVLDALGRGDEEKLLRGPSPCRFPSGLSEVPFTWTVFDTTYEMAWLAGFTSVSQDQTTLALCPEIGWIVAPQQRPRFVQHMHPSDLAPISGPLTRDSSLRHSDTAPPQMPKSLWQTSPRPKSFDESFQEYLDSLDE